MGNSRRTAALPCPGGRRRRRRDRCSCARTQHLGWWRCHPAPDTSVTADVQERGLRAEPQQASSWGHTQPPSQQAQLAPPTFWHSSCTHAASPPRLLKPASHSKPAHSSVKLRQGWTMTAGARVGGCLGNEGRPQGVHHSAAHWGVHHTRKPAMVSTCRPRPPPLACTAGPRRRTCTPASMCRGRLGAAPRAATPPGMWH